MGQTMSCEKCPTAVNHSVVTFSEPLILKLTEGREPEPLTEEELQEENDDIQWFEKLKCIDESHSEAYGLTRENFESITRRIERLSGKKADTEPPCDLEQVMECYKKNSKCTIKCTDLSNKLVDCVDGRGLKELASKTLKRDTEETTKSPKK